MEGARSSAPMPAGRKRGKQGAETIAPADMRPEVLVRQIKKLEGEMFKKARNLEFEEAARLRDEIDRMKQLELGLPRTLAG
jgi:excinuclease ABC subunit B